MFCKQKVSCVVHDNLHTSWKFKKNVQNSSREKIYKHDFFQFLIDDWMYWSAIERTANTILNMSRVCRAPPPVVWFFERFLHTTEND